MSSLEKEMRGSPSKSSGFWGKLDSSGVGASLEESRLPMGEEWIVSYAAVRVIEDMQKEQRAVNGLQ